MNKLSIMLFSTGQKYVEENFSNGKRHGKSTAYRQNGTVCLEANYKNGVLHGNRTIYVGNEKFNTLFVYGLPYINFYKFLKEIVFSVIKLLDRGLIKLQYNTKYFNLFGFPRKYISYILLWHWNRTSNV